MLHPLYMLPIESVVFMRNDHILTCYSIDPYTKKDWYDVKAPAMFTQRNIGKTLVTRTQGKSTYILKATTVRL